MNGPWFLLPLVGPIRISTVLGAVAIFVAIGIWRRRPLIALVATIAWASTFEILYNGAGVVMWHWPVADFLWQVAALLGWVIAAEVLGVRPPWWGFVPFAVVACIWLLTGFHSNVPNDPTRPFVLQDEVLNEVTKSALAVAYLAAAARLPAARANRTLALSVSR
jgi:hypothetical protein